MSLFLPGLPRLQISEWRLFTTVDLFQALEELEG